MSELAILDADSKGWQQAYRCANYLLNEGIGVSWATEPFSSVSGSGEKTDHSRGALLISDPDVWREAVTDRFGLEPVDAADIDGFAGLALKRLRIGHYGGGGAPMNHDDAVDRADLRSVLFPNRHTTWCAGGAQRPVLVCAATASRSDANHPVIRISGADCHGQLDNGSVSRGAKVAGREPCYIHPEAAAARGINAGDIVCLKNRRGACLAGAVLTDTIRRDTVALATGAFLDLRWIDGRRIEINGNPNVLTRDEGCSQLSHVSSPD